MLFVVLRGMEIGNFIGCETVFGNHIRCETVSLASLP